MSTKASNQPYGSPVCLSGCCSEVDVVGQGAVRDAQSHLYQTYTIEPDLLNGKVHYTSKDGEEAIAYDGSRSEWNIQSASKRCVCELCLATVWKMQNCQHNLVSKCSV